MVNVAILGFGTVGSGVAQVLSENGPLIHRRAAELVRLKHILVRTRRESPFQHLYVDDFSTIEQDPEVDIVVEVIGGIQPALDYTVRALKAGKSVVTANKELVAAHGCQLLKLARENGVSYLFEASVGGGIPILRPLTSCLAANRLEQVTGILNGTTNYILTRMIRAGLSFEQALQEAQDLGYAESDPTADVEGHDACRKICILAALAFGRHVYPRQVPTQGITGVTLEDVSFAGAGGYKIKLLGRAIRQGEDKVCAFVSPHLVPDSHPLAGVEDVFNAICVTGDAIGEAMFYGRGAGRLPTASAVVADVIDIAKDLRGDRHNSWEEGGDDLVTPAQLYPSPWYVRLAVPAQQVRPRLDQVRELTWQGAPQGHSALLTRSITQQQLQQALEGLPVLSQFRVLA